MIVKGTVQLIWNLIQLWFVGKILGVVRYFGGLLKGLIAGIWDVIKVYLVNRYRQFGMQRKVFLVSYTIVLNQFYKYEKLAI